MASKRSIPALPWNEARLAPVVLVTGPEEYLVTRVWQRLRDAARAAHADAEVHEVQASEYQAGELLTLASPSLFGEPRLIRIRGLEQCTDAFIADAKAYLPQPDADTTVIIEHGGGQRGKAVLDLIRSGVGGAVEVSCPAMKPAEYPGLVRDELRSSGATIDGAAMQSLVQAFQGRIEELMAVTAQLAATVQGKITLAHVEDLTGGRIETNAFRVADAALAGNAAEALVALRHTLSTGATPIPVLAAIASKLRVMARLYGAGGAPGQLAAEAGASPWQVSNALKELRGWREADLARVINEAAATELRLKGGARDVEYALEQFVLLVARKGKPLQ